MMKKGITPIISIIILLLITIGLAGAAWTYMSRYFTGLTAKAVEIADAYCTGGTDANLVIRNVGTETLSVGCDDCRGKNTCKCTDLTIVKTNDNFGGTSSGNNPRFDTNSIEPGSTAIFKEGCTSQATPKICNYRVIVKGSGRGQTASVSCTG